jgi:hypothetical protein
MRRRFDSMHKQRLNGLRSSGLPMAIPKRPRKCRVCKADFQPTKPLQNVCGIECAIEASRISNERSKAKQAKAERVAEAASRKIIKQKLEKLKPLSYFANKAQAATNAEIRERDKEEPCISCGRFHQGKWNAGHYISRGASPALRFHPDNIHKQCEPCNTSLSGNLVNYRKRLIEKIGIERVEWLEGPHELPRWRKEDYQRIEAEAKAKLKEMQIGN